MEGWSIGVMVMQNPGKRINDSFLCCTNTPVLQFFNTPILHLSSTPIFFFKMTGVAIREG
jgi:hypothetical protein